jgi:sulfoxide reductase catalytic subunit YedY
MAVQISAVHETVFGKPVNVYTMCVMCDLEVNMVEIDRSEITPEHLYLSRRRFIKGLGLAAAGAALQACAPTGASTGTPAPTATSAAPAATPQAAEDTAPLPTLSAETDELGDELTTLPAIGSYTNYYEFTFSKEGVGALTTNFETAPWSVEVGGLVKSPKTYNMQALLGFTQQERIYRMRCVEGWSMVIPWIGFPLAELLAEVEPTAEAQYVRFEAPYRPEQMPNQKSNQLPWPYVEGLRLDEAMHDLTILATGLYGRPLLPQNGAPIRLVVPWKYGFKSIKSVVKIELVAEMPVSTWMNQAPNEYGFYANVNPDVPHPRWSQATERRIGESGRRKTLLFNGYEEEVASLYEGMDLAKWY